VRVGVLRTLFGAAPEDAEVAAVVQRALGYLAGTGAEVADVDLPGLADLVQGTSVIAAEFKFDLLDYFARRPGAPVTSLADILKGGSYHPAVEDVLARAEAAGARADAGYLRTLERRATLRETVTAAMARLRVDALAYPTVRRKPARIGEAQAGSNCQLSASTGLPAISMPAGFTDDGLPVGVELLGGAFAEPQLLRIAWAYEQAVHPRRAPRSTP
jgi:Asp-tRNA(Asn)/Glu-tRNA(Gln) amidotransferase A subunit family amidase